jgi:hypothetical protein
MGTQTPELVNTDVETHETFSRISKLHSEQTDIIPPRWLGAHDAKRGMTIFLGYPNTLNDDQADECPGKKSSRISWAFFGLLPRRFG